MVQDVGAGMAHKGSADLHHDSKRSRLIYPIKPLVGGKVTGHVVGTQSVGGETYVHQEASSRAIDRVKPSCSRLSVLGQARTNTVLGHDWKLAIPGRR